MRARPRMKKKGWQLCLNSIGCTTAFGCSQHFETVEMVEVLCPHTRTVSLNAKFRSHYLSIDKTSK